MEVGRPSEPPFHLSVTRLRVRKHRMRSVVSVIRGGYLKKVLAFPVNSAEEPSTYPASCSASSI